MVLVINPKIKNTKDENIEDENMLIAKKFIANQIKIHGKHQVFTDEGTRYPQVCKIMINN
jgi:hypothetical protein